MKLPLLHIRQWSLTARLLLFFAVISLMAWLVATLIAVYTSTNYIKTFFDTQQILLAKTLVSTHLEPMSSELPPTKELLPFGQGNKLKREDDEALGFALFSAQGHVLLTDGEHGKDFPFMPNKEKFSKVMVDDEEWRILWLYSADRERVAAVGQEMEYRNDMILEILWGQLSPWIIILPFLLLGLGIALYRELKPIRSIANDLNHRKAHDTSPLLHENIPPEIKPLITSLNTLFERIGILLTHERAFVSNAAHELRTPLTGLKIQAEVLAMSDEDPEAQKHAVQKILQAADKCSHLIDQLLLLSQLENQFSTPSNCPENKNLFEPIDWEKLIINAHNEMQADAKKRQIAMDYAINAIPAKHMGLPSLWAIALRNIVDNAIRHTPKGGAVHITLKAEAFCVENVGINIDENILPHLGKRFYRPPGQKATGSGLGLAIVNHITQLHGAKFSINNKSATENSVLACINFN